MASEAQPYSVAEMHGIVQETPSCRPIDELAALVCRPESGAARRSALAAGIERIAQAIARQVEAENGQGDGEAGDPQWIPGLVHRSGVTSRSRAGT